MSFRLKTILGVALIEAVLLGVLLTSGLRYMAETAEAEFVQRAGATARAFSVAGRNALIASDLGALEALAREMLEYPGVVFARVRAPEGQALVEAGDAAALQAPARVDRTLDDAGDGLFRVAVDVVEAGTPFGRIELGLRSTELRERGALALRYGLSLGALEMALVALFSWILGSYLTRQLVQLEQASRRIAEGELGTQVPVSGSDELARTATAFNRMSDRVADSFRRLERSEAAGRRVLESILDGILELAPDGRVLTASARAGGILGQAPEALIGQPVAGLLMPQGAAALQSALDALGAVGTGGTAPAPFEVQARIPDGEPRWIELQVAVIADGGAAARLLVLRDVQARVDARLSMLLRSRIIDTSAEGVVIADARRPGWPVVFVNPAFEHITGYAPGEILGRTCAILQREETRGPELDRLRAALAAREPVQVLLRNFTKQGRPFWNELRIAPIRDDTGTVTHLVGLQNDATARIEAERALVAREAHLSQVLNATHDAMLVLDERRAVVSFNEGAGRMLGLEAASSIGRPLVELLPSLRGVAGLAAGVAVADADADADAATPSPAGHRTEVMVERPPASPLWTALQVVELGGREPGRFLCVFHDITAGKAAELELRSAKDAAEAAAHAKSEFLANMSHEIRTPLHGVLGAMEMLADTPLSGQQQRFIETARTSANMLLGVIDEILDFSRLEAGKLRIERLDFDLHRTVEDVTSVLAQRAHAKKVELACYIAPEVPQMVASDPIRLRQVLVNLVGNAIKFTELGEVVVSCGVLPGVVEPRLLFEVRDTGIGIAPHKQALLFSPFSQADSSTSRRYGGSGLGLSISRRLVELMGGRIGFESREGEGSRFWFELPLVPARGRLRPDRSGALAGVRVLVVDDNATNRVILHRYLTQWNAQSGSASGGEEALAKLQDAAASGQPYELVLLDLNMPAMDGYALLRQIQSDAGLARVPVIMLSSSVQEPERMQGLRVDVWLDKPVRQSDLHDAIATVLGARPPAQAPAPVAGRGGLRFAGERVLLVEDYEITRELGVQMLRNLGLAVDAAESGHQAVEAVRRQDYDVVLMDIQMPDLDGYETTARIRRWEAEAGRPRVPIVALTAHALPADRERCLAADMDDYVAKPYSAATVGAAVARWLMPPGRSAAPDRPAVLDAGRLQEVRDVMRDDFADLMARAARGIAALSTDLAREEATDDPRAARELVHQMKNVAGNVGALRLHEIAADAEAQLERAPLDGLRVRQLHAEAGAAVAALEALSAPPAHTP
jgi:PAS domain S-box-containing protein